MSDAASKIKKRRRGPVVAIAAVWLLFVSPISQSHAQSAPSSLRGKSIIASWQDSRTYRDIETGRTGTITQTTTVRLYVSSLGRIFSELMRSTGRDTKQDDQISNQGRLKWTFQGRSLIADQQLGPGATAARHLAIDFDDKYAACSIKVVVGKDTGSPTFLYRSMTTHRMREMLYINVRSTNCSMQDGNVFGISG